MQSQGKMVGYKIKPIIPAENFHDVKARGLLRSTTCLQGGCSHMRVPSVLGGETVVSACTSTGGLDSSTARVAIRWVVSSVSVTDTAQVELRSGRE